MTIRLSPFQLDALARAARQAQPDEACALLLGETDSVGAEVSLIAFSENVTTGDPSQSFEIEPMLHLGLQKAARAGGPAIIGVWHSHPNGSASPSKADCAQSVMPGWIWLITAVSAQDATTAAFRAGIDDPHNLKPVTLLSPP